MSAAWPDEVSRLEQLVAHYKAYGVPTGDDGSLPFIQARRDALRLMLKAYESALAEIESITPHPLTPIPGSEVNDWDGR